MVNLKFGSVEYKFALHEKKLHIPSIKELFALHVVLLNDKVEPADHRGLTFTEFEDDQDIIVTGTAATGGGTAEAEDPEEPKYKKVKIHDAPSLLSPKRVATLGLIPQAGHEASSVAFYCGRQCAVDLPTVLPVLLQAPEFGLIYDTAYNIRGCIAPQANHFQAAMELQDQMALVYQDEKTRQNVFVGWFKRYFPEHAIIVPRNNSSSYSGNNDGPVTFKVGNSTYCMCLLEAEHDGGDAIYQAVRYVQLLYGDSESWGKDPVLRASGAPALILELLGTCLTIHGCYTIEGNVMAAEPLTPRLLMLPLDERQEQPALQLARVLAGLDGGLALLRRRISVMAGQAGVPLERLMNQLDMSQDYRADLGRALGLATLLGNDARRAAEHQGQSAVQAAPARWARLPYPLLPSCCSVLEPVEGYEERPLFICNQSSGGRVLVKFTCREYPVQVHRVLAELGVTSKLLDFMRLPGGWCMVVQEYLGDGWKSCSSLTPQQRTDLLPSVTSAMTIMHAAVVDGSGRAVVHGDLRPPNVMWHERDGVVKIVDLGWAGLEGVARYPARMAGSIAWHSEARPGRLLKREHDEHMLQRFV